MRVNMLHRISSDFALKKKLLSIEQINYSIENALQIFYSPVPKEIQAQGHRAEAAFQKAMDEGSVEVYYGRIMLIGQDRAGKTSLKKSLLGIPFDLEEESTVGVEVDQVKNWQLTDQKKLDLSDFREDIAKIIADGMKDLEQERNDPSRLHDLFEVFYSFNDLHKSCT